MDAQCNGKPLVIRGDSKSQVVHVTSTMARLSNLCIRTTQVSVRIFASCHAGTVIVSVSVLPLTQCPYYYLHLLEETAEHAIAFFAHALQFI